MFTDQVPVESVFEAIIIHTGKLVCGKKKCKNQPTKKKQNLIILTLKRAWKVKFARNTPNCQLKQLHH